MKRKLKLLAAAVCAAAMVTGIAGSTLAAGTEDIDIAAVYQMAQKALDQQAIQNIMSRHVMYHCYGLHQEELEQIWVQEPENQATASFGQNQGYMVGYPAIWEAYVDGHTESWLETAKNYCASNDIDIEGWTDEHGFVYSQDRKRLLKAPTEWKEYWIPEGVEKIDRLAFIGCKYEDLHIPYTCKTEEWPIEECPVYGSERVQGCVWPWGKPYSEKDGAPD